MCTSVPGCRRACRRRRRTSSLHPQNFCVKMLLANEARTVLQYLHVHCADSGVGLATVGDGRPLDNQPSGDHHSLDRPSTTIDFLATAKRRRSENLPHFRTSFSNQGLNRLCAYPSAERAPLGAFSHAISTGLWKGLQSGHGLRTRSFCCPHSSCRDADAS